MNVEHDYTPSEHVNVLGQVQNKYCKKKWSSVMILDNSRYRALTPEYVTTRAGLDLHQFKWPESEDLIGNLPVYWNFVV